MPDDDQHHVLGAEKIDRLSDQEDLPIDPPSTERIRAHGILRDVFIARVLHLIPSWVFVSDTSVLADFPEPAEAYAERIRQIYEVDVTTLPDQTLPTILDAISEQRWREQ